MPGLRSDFLSDRRGASSMIFAAGVFVVFGFGAIAIDGGNFFYQKRRQQTATDLAALAAASDLARADAAARASASRNGYAAGDVNLVQTGTYTPDAALTPDQRFRPGPAAGANAVRIEMLASVPMVLGQVLNAASAQNEDSVKARKQTDAASGEVPIRTGAIAAQDAQAAFAVGSRLLKLEGGVLNGVLGALLGTNLTLTVMDYEALARARIELFGFSQKLATRASLSALTFEQVAQSQVRLGDILNAARDQAGGAEASAALGRIATALPPSGQRLTLQSLVSFGSHGGRSLAEEAPMAASLSALDLVSAVAQLANGARQLDLALAVKVPGVASASLKLGIGERPVGSSMVRVGRAGASVHTAQTRLLLTLELVGSGQATLVRLPLYVELAAATAKLTAVACSPGEVATARVTLGVTPALVDAWIGQVSSGEFGNFSGKPNPPAATLLNLAGLARVSGRAHATMTNTGETPVQFSYADIQRAEKKTTSTNNAIATLLSRLVADLELRVEALGLGLPAPGLGGAVSGAIAGAATPLDQILGTVLGTLGIGLGQADSWVSGVRCGGAALIQ